MSLKYKQFVVKDMTQVADDQIECIIATSDVDRDNEILNIDGLDTSSFEKNPVVLLSHDYDSLPVGKCISLTKSAGQLKGIIQFAVGEYDVAKTVCALYKGGYMNAVSIGFIPSQGFWNQVKDAFEYTVAEMLEFSCVAVPANANALVTAKSMGIDIDVLKGVKFDKQTEKEEEREEAEEEQIDEEDVIDKATHVIKEGRTLSDKNMKCIKAAHTLITKVLQEAGEEMGSTPMYPMPDDPEAAGEQAEADGEKSAESHNHSIQEGKTQQERQNSRPAKLIKRVKLVLKKD